MLNGAAYFCDAHFVSIGFNKVDVAVGDDAQQFPVQFPALCIWARPATCCVFRHKQRQGHYPLASRSSGRRPNASAEPCVDGRAAAPVERGTPGAVPGRAVLPRCVVPVTGKPVKPWSSFNLMMSATVASGLTQTGSLMKPCLYFYTAQGEGGEGGVERGG